MVAAERYKQRVAQHFALYPEADDESDTPSMRPALTRLGPAEYEVVVYEWPLRRLLTYLEQVRLRDAFDDLDADMDEVLSSSPGF